MKLIRLLPYYFFSLVFASLLLSLSSNVLADKYRIDTEGGHASINFKIKHLGYSWLTGRFNDFKGTFFYDTKNPSKSHIEVTVKTKSIDSGHAERDKHLRGKKFLNVRKFPEAKFMSTHYKQTSKTSGILNGQLSLHGITKPVSMSIKQIGAGRDPWGGFRRGFETRLKIRLGDFGIKHSLGSASEELELIIYIEGIKDHQWLENIDTDS